MGVLRDLASYLKALLAEGRTVIFTIFDVLGFTLFLFPQLGQRFTEDEALARVVGGSIVLVSFLLGNFTLYRKMASGVQVVGEDSFLLYPYQKQPYNNVEIRYIGPETVKDVAVWQSYTDGSGQPQRRQVTEFFPPQDTDMIWHQFKANVLEPGDIVRAHLVLKKTAGDSAVLVELEGIGAKSGRRIHVEKRIDLQF